MNQHGLQKAMASAEKAVYVLGNLGFLWTCRSLKLLTSDQNLVSKLIVRIADIRSIFSLKICIHHT